MDLGNGAYSSVGPILCIQLATGSLRVHWTILPRLHQNKAIQFWAKNVFVLELEA
jgi:hypothetical protein